MNMDYFDIKNNKRYNTYDFYLKNKFSSKVSKISLNGGFTCPNIDGKKGIGGCTYCSSLGSGDFAGNPLDNIKTQFNIIKERMSSKWKCDKFIAYFQANTNTYAPLSILKEKFEDALLIEGVVGLSISTRADCLEDDVVDYLYDLSKRTYLTVELGLQTINDDTANIINRCHSYDEFLVGYNKLKKYGINICIHIINGLPNETFDDMMKTAKAVADLRPHSVKIHMLHILKGTVMADEYQKENFNILNLEEYVNIVTKQIKLLPADIVIARVTGDGKKEDLLAPLWTLKKFVVINEIDKILKAENTYQGCLANYI